MTDYVPNHPLNRSREIEDRVRFKHIEEKARASRPVDTGHDILRTHLGDLPL